MQIERISNPLIGAQYWLSPTQIFPERAKRLAELREQYRISTSLSVLARAINIRIYEETRSGIIIDEAEFWDIAECQIQLIREKENELRIFRHIRDTLSNRNVSIAISLFCT
jgi:hypothetical protein